MDLSGDTITLSWPGLAALVAGIAYVVRLEVNQYWLKKNTTALWKKVDPGAEGDD